MSIRLEQGVQLIMPILEQVLDDILGSYRDNPVDLLNIGDADGEYVYLTNARRSYERTIRDVLVLYAKRPVEERPIKILEIGSYLGVVSIVLAKLGFSVTALDIPEFMANNRLQERYNRYGVATLTANLREYCIPAVSGEYDLVIMCETLEHFDFNPIPVLLEVNRVLQESGVLYLSLPNLASLVNRVKLLCGRSIHNPVTDFAEQLAKMSNMIVGIHWREYTAAELRELLDLSGFSIVSHEFFTTHRASLLARLAYALFPRLRPNQTLLARKAAAINSDFHFSDATR